MGRNERVAVWAIIGVLTIWLLVLTVMGFGEIEAINAVLGEDGGFDERAGRDGESTPWWGQAPEPSGGKEEATDDGPQIGVAGVRVLSDTLTMTVTVRSSGVGDLLYEPPVVTDEGGRVYRAEGKSLEEARYAFLDLITRGQATAQLRFAGASAPGARLALIFNPNQHPGDALAPRVEVMVPVIVETAPAEMGE